jgi:hypothetical protein
MNRDAVQLDLSYDPQLTREAIAPIERVMTFSGGRLRGILQALHANIALQVAVTYVCVRHLAASCANRGLPGII